MTLAVDAFDVVEAVTTTKITKVPGSNNILEGVLSHEKQSIYVFNPFRYFYPEQASAHHEIKKIVVVKVEQGLVGFIVDDLGDIPEVDPGQIDKAVSVGTSEFGGFIESIIRPEYINGEYEDVIFVINPNSFVNLLMGDAKVDPRDLIESSKAGQPELQPVSDFESKSDEEGIAAAKAGNNSEEAA